MIRVQIINANNLPVPTAKERKTKIFCFSTSSCNYIYEAYKNDENTKNPKWNKSFDVDLFRCSVLTFKLYSSHLFTNDIFLGELKIDFSLFLTQSPGNEILKIPYGNIRCEFPLTSCSSPDANLSLSFLFIPKSYCPIQFKDISSPIIHLWATFTPALKETENNIEIELLQVYIGKDKKSQSSYFYKLGNCQSWESVGYSSTSHTFLGPTGFTPVRSFLLDRISNTYNFFIVKVPNYSGVITLNFIAEKKKKEESFENKLFNFVKKENKNSIGTIKTVDINVEPNKIYCAPVYLFCEKKLIKTTFEMNQFQQLSEDYIKSQSEITCQLCSEIPFLSSIIDAAQNKIEELNDKNITKTFVLPIDEKVSINKVFNEFNLQQRTQIRIYINGSKTHTNGQSCFTHFWKPFFTIFDLNTGQACHELTKKLLKKPNYHFRLPIEKNYLPFDWHTYVDLNLDEIGIDKVVIFSICSMSPLNLANPPGMIIISHINADKETILFRNPIYVDTCKTYWSSFMRFEFIEDNWTITQMRYPFTRKKKFEMGINTLFKNNWMMPEIVMDESDNSSKSFSSDDFLLDEI